MKAVVLDEFGDPHRMRLAEIPDPAPGPGQIRIAVHAAGVNPVDIGNRRDGSWAGLSAPCVVGYDVAGVIDQVGPGVTDLCPGDRVMAMMRFRDGAGGYAELAVVDAEQVARIHAGTSFIDAAATPLAAGTAYSMLNRLCLKSGQRILVLGASGGVGMFLLQLAAASGLEVIAVGRQATHAQMLALGATACIDYTVEHVARRAAELTDGRVDAIADLVGGRILATTLEALRGGGQIATIATPSLDLDLVLDNNLTLHGVLVVNDGDRTRRLADLLGTGSLRAVVRHVLPLSAAARAHEILEGGHAGGKVVLRIRDPQSAA